MPSSLSIGGYSSDSRSSENANGRGSGSTAKSPGGDAERSLRLVLSPIFGATAMNEAVAIRHHAQPEREPARW
jgi:hypothetical protein